MLARPVGAAEGESLKVGVRWCRIVNSRFLCESYSKW
jgi:hypothetical protein